MFAHDVLGQAMAAAGTINRLLLASSMIADGLAVPIGSVTEELDKWIKRLLDKLAEIVTNLAKGTSSRSGRDQRYGDSQLPADRSGVATGCWAGPPCSPSRRSTPAA